MTKSFIATVSIALVSTAFLFVTATTVAETITVPIGTQARDKQAIERPSAGMKKEQVEAKFGQPLQTKSAVGEPPISSWSYADFIVYFEYDHVVHTVLRHTAAVATAASSSD